jgi:prepilin-type N-terminal cleavage/methylation domain-containing protein
MSATSPLRADGFTLIEILVAVSIFSVSLLGLAVGTVSVAQTNNKSHLIVAAVNLGQEKLEQLSSMTKSAFGGLSCPTYSSAGCSDQPIASNQSFSRSWQITVDSPVAGVTKMEVKVDWTDYTSHSLTFSASLPK